MAVSAQASANRPKRSVPRRCNNGGTHSSATTSGAARPAAFQAMLDSLMRP